MTDRNVTVVRRLNYDPYGRELATSSGTAFARFRFVGGYIDGTELYHFGQRFTSPGSGAGPNWTRTTIQTTCAKATAISMSGATP